MKRKIPIYQDHLGDLANMLSIDPSTEHHWDASDLAAILRHQLQTPLLPDLAPYNTRTDVASSATESPHTFAQLLCSDSYPSIDLLRQTKDFAKACANSTGSALPKPVATAIYYAAISAAMVYHYQLITSLDHASLRSGLTWVTQNPWIDQEIRCLAATALNQSNPIS